MEEGVGEVADVVDANADAGFIVEIGVSNREPPSSGGSGLNCHFYDISLGDDEGKANWNGNRVN